MNKKITILLIAIVAFLIVVAGIIQFTGDRKAPEITVSETTISYSEGSDKSVLLDGVTAVDNIDGDVTGNVKVDSVAPMANGTQAVVTYVVKDEKNNIATATRIVEYVAKPKPTPTPSATPTPTPTPEPTVDPNADPEIPVITLTTSTITLDVDEDFVYYEYIESMSDDMDSYNELSYNISVQGDFETKAKGTYVLTYTIGDSDGNVSNPAVLTLVRE